MNIKTGLILFFLSLPVLIFSQTAADMETILTAEKVNAAKAARFILGAADLLQSGLSGAAAERAAYDMASSKGWVKIKADQNVNQKDTAFLIMKAFDIKGGIMYSLFKNPRYAYREMVYHSLIPGRTDQALEVSGPRLLLILDKTMSFTGEYAGTGSRSSTPAERW